MNMMNTHYDRSRGFELKSEGDRTKYIVLAAIALAFAVGVYFAAGGSSKKETSKAKPAAQAVAQKSAAPTVAESVAPEPAPATTGIATSTSSLATTESAQVNTHPNVAAQAMPSPTPAESLDDLTAHPESGAYAATEDVAAEPAAAAEVADAPVATKRSAPAKMLRELPPPASVALNPWWNAKSGSAFKVEYVGQAAQQAALVIRFSKSLAAPEDAARYIQLVGQDGASISSGWQPAGNGFVLVSTGLAPGRYTVRIDPTLSSSGGESLATPLSGPIYIE